MSTERAVATRKEELTIMKKRLRRIKEGGNKEEIMEAEKRIKLVQEAIKELGGES